MPYHPPSWRQGGKLSPSRRFVLPLVLPPHLLPLLLVQGSTSMFMHPFRSLPFVFCARSSARRRRLEFFRSQRRIQLEHLEPRYALAAPVAVADSIVMDVNTA